ncbi:hypothetical protein JKF63_01866 [Porcisia hertigi]|uniref:non-specific serine/threonine protein kinase n=1 Tax=Porcisia hertigi TaxID=2761500 RepID=A0A836LB85_9TRYP|nr:hypothetical protein JKF63_01866 [Porcisia hertigi]
MQVDIGSNAVLQNFTSIVSSEEIRHLNDRLRQEYRGAASSHTTGSHHQGDSALGIAQPHRHRHPQRDLGAPGAPGYLDRVPDSSGRSSLNQSRSSVGSRLSYQRHETRLQSRTAHSCSVRSRSPGKVATRSPQVVVGVSKTALGPWINTSATTSATNNNLPLSNLLTTQGITRGFDACAVDSLRAQQLSLEPVAAVRGRERLSPRHMATLTSTQQRQEGWCDAAHYGKPDSAAGAVDDSHVRAEGSPSKGMVRNKGRSHHRAEEGSAGGEGAGNNNRNEKPAPAAGPKLAQTKIQVGMRLRRWIIINRIGAGSFGETFTAIEVPGPVAEEGSLTVSPENLAMLEDLPPLEERNEVCIKVEQENKNVLRLEALALKKVQPCAQVVRYIGSGCTSGMNYLVMEKLGPNLAELRRHSRHGTFNIYTTLKAGISCLTAIRGVHDLGLVHRDIKPSNFVTGLPGTSEHTTCYLIDFGLARRFRRSNGEIRPPRDNAGFRGTSRYASVASHHHHELGRVDDIWSLLFMLVEFATGTLPWRKYKEKDDIGRCKEESISPHLVRNLPREFQPFLAHLQTLRYEDEPDYDLLLTLMHRALERRGYPPNKAVEWELDSSLVNSSLDADGAPVLDAGVRAVQDSSAHHRDGNPPNNVVVNRHGNSVDASGRAPQPPPRRAAPQPDALEKDPRGAPTPMHPGAEQQGVFAGTGGASNRIPGNGVAVHGHPAEAPHLHNSGTLRVSEVDIGYSGACQDSLLGNTAFGGDASIQCEWPHPRAGSVDIPGTTAGFAVEGSATPGAPASSDEFEPNEYSPRENHSGVCRYNEAPPPYFNADPNPVSNHHGNLVSTAPLAVPVPQPNSSTHRRAVLEDHNEKQRCTNQQQCDAHSDEPESSNRRAVRPQQRIVVNPADLDSTYMGDEQGVAPQGKGGKLLHKKSNCECIVM